MLHRNFLLEADILLVSYHKNTHKSKANNPEQAPKDEANHCGPHCKSDLFPHLEPHISPAWAHICLSHWHWTPLPLSWKTICRIRKCSNECKEKGSKMLPLLQHEVECAAISKEAHVQPGAVLTDERVTLSYQLLLLPASAPLLWCLAQFPNEPLPDCLHRTNLLHWQEFHVQKVKSLPSHSMERTIKSQLTVKEMSKWQSN